MKILFLIDSLGSGGAQRQVATLANILKEKSYDVSVLCYAHEDFFAKHLDEVDIPIFWEIESNTLKRILRIRRFIRKGDYNTVISFLDVPNFLNCFAAVGGKSWKVITSERSAKREIFSTCQGKIFAWFQRYADTIVCNSNNARNMWLEFYPQYENKLDVIYNPVILPEITSEYVPKRNGKLNIVVAASYQYLKNPIGLIKALALLDANQRKQIKVDWYGRIEVSVGNNHAYLEAIALIKEYNLEEVIQLYEPTSDIINIMNKSDIVALFSEVEGLPNAICEGMMIGKPIIMSKVSDYTTLIDKTNGVLCDWGNAESIKEAILYMTKLTIDELLEKGKQSKIKADKLFSVKVIEDKWIELI